jgi:ATP-binding cassette subfamily F protein uup
MLAKVLKNGGNLIVLDEPTNDLDLPSLRMLEEALAVFDGSVIVVSHDRYFLDRICDQIIAFEDDGIAVQAGNYSYYLEKRQARESAQRIQAQAAARDAAAKQKSAAAPVAKKGRKLTFNEKNELEGMETAILAIEKEAEGLEALLHDPNFQAKRFSEIPELVEKLDADKAKVAKLYTRWEELEAIREAAQA